MSNIPQNFVIGQNVQIILTDSFGGTYLLSDFGHGTSFEATVNDTLIHVVPITNGGLPLNRRNPHGWTGTIRTARYNGFLSDYIALYDKYFYSTGNQLFLTMTVNIQEADGSIGTYIFTYVVLHKPTFGDYVANKETEQTFDFDAQELLSDAVDPLGSAGIPTLAPQGFLYSQSGSIGV